MTAHDSQIPDEVRFIRERLDALERERMRLELRLRRIEQGRNVTKPTPLSEPTVTNTSPAADKIALFRNLFAGRIDVFPTRWENPKSGRSGYAPCEGPRRRPYQVSGRTWWSRFWWPAFWPAWFRWTAFLARSLLGIRHRPVLGADSCRFCLGLLLAPKSGEARRDAPAPCLFMAGLDNKRRRDSARLFLFAGTPGGSILGTADARRPPAACGRHP
jgi:hypothetical protein